MPYDSEATRARILAAAVEEFSTHGIAGARVDRIAEKAQANKQAIYAYFGNKEALFARVIQHVLAEAIEAVPTDPDDLPGYAARLYDHHRAHPEFVRLMLWEALEFGDREVPAEPERRAHHEQKTAAVRGAQDAGTIDADLDPAALTMFIVGLVNWTLGAPQLRRLLGADLPPEQMRAQIARAVERLTQPSASPWPA